MTNVTTFERLPQALTVDAPRPRTLWQLPLWSGLLILTSLILAYPVNLRLVPYEVWSSEIFPNLPLLGALFYTWMFFLVVLLFAPLSGREARQERLLLVAIAALVFRGFWVTIAPIQGQALSHVSAAMVWQLLGHVVGAGAGINYVEWPGVSLAIITISQISGLDLIASTGILNVFIALLIAVAAYLFLEGALGSSLLAGLASLLIIEGSLGLVILLSGGPLALPLMVLFLAVLFQPGALENTPRRVVALLALGGAAIIHLHISVHFVFILLGLWGFGALRKQRFGIEPGLSTIALYFIIPIAWILYAGTGSAFFAITRGGALALLDPLRVVERLVNMFTIGQANFGGSVPSWYSNTRLFWFGLLYITGGLFWLWGLKNIRKMEASEAKLSAAFAGVALLNLIGVLISTMGSAELLRLLTTGVFFTSPLLLLLLQRLRWPQPRVALVSLAAVMVAVSFPTFLSDNLRINTLNFSRAEASPGQWLYSLYGTGEVPHIFTFGDNERSIQFYLDQAVFTIEPPSMIFDVWTTDSLWQAVDELMKSMGSSVDSGESSMFVDSPKHALQAGTRFAVSPQDPHWAALTRFVSERYHKVFDNGPVSVYARRGR